MKRRVLSLPFVPKGVSLIPNAGMVMAMAMTSDLTSVTDALHGYGYG